MNLRFVKEVKMEVDNEILPGELAIPYDAKGVVVFSHGSGSGRFSPRNRQVQPGCIKNRSAPCCSIC